MIFKLHPKFIFKALLLFTLLLVVLHIVFVVGIRMSPFANSPSANNFNRLAKAFDLDYEENVPALYSAAILMFSSILLAFIAFKNKLLEVSWLPWAGLAAIMCFLSADEAMVLHEPVGQVVQSAFGISEAYYYVWAIPYSLAAGMFGLLYLKFLLKLPKETRILFFLSGIIFVLGAAGFELLGNLHVQTSGTKKTLFYQLLLVCEEFLEMFGVLVFIYALLQYITNQFGFFGLVVEDTISGVSWK